MATIYEREYPSGEKSFRAQVRVKGYPTLSATFDRKTDARIWSQKIETEMRAGRYVDTVEAQRHTFGDMIDRYIEDTLPGKSAGTVRAQMHHLLWWKQRLGKYMLSMVTPALIVEARGELLKGTTPHGDRRAPSTVVRYLAALSHCYSIAMKEWGWVEDTPMRKVSKPKESSGRTRFLSDDERTRLLDACRESRNPHLYTIVVLAMSSGMRRGEIANLRWDQVDLQRAVIRLLSDDTKTSHARAVPIAGPAHEGLLSLAEAKVRPLNNLVFASADPSSRAKPIEFQNAWKKALERAGIEDFRFHDLRHTAASYLAMNGATLAEIAEVLGHKTLAMVKRYAHLTEQHTSGVVRRMNAAVFGE
jgi:integrase